MAWQHGVALLLWQRVFSPRHFPLPQEEAGMSIQRLQPTRFARDQKGRADRLMWKDRKDREGSGSHLQLSLDIP